MRCCNAGHRLAIARHAALKTDKARQELAPACAPSLRERSLLLLAEGKLLSELQAMRQRQRCAQIVESTCSARGYLSLSAPALQDTLPSAPQPVHKAPLSPVTTCGRWRCAYVPVRHLRTPVCPPRPGTGAAFSQRLRAARDQDACCTWANRCWRKVATGGRRASRDHSRAHEAALPREQPQDKTWPRRRPKPPTRSGQAQAPQRCDFAARAACRHPTRRPTCRGGA